MKRLFTMGLALLMVLTMVPMSCHASNLDAGIGGRECNVSFYDCFSGSS